jgi:hypothetical protein
VPGWAVNVRAGQISPPRRRVRRENSPYKNILYDCHSERSRPIGLPIGRRSRRTPAVPASSRPIQGVLSETVQRQRQDPAATGCFVSGHDFSRAEQGCCKRPASAAVVWQRLKASPAMGRQSAWLKPCPDTKLPFRLLGGGEEAGVPPDEVTCRRCCLGHETSKIVCYERREHH